MSYFRTGVAIATMLMGLDFAFADCPVPESIENPSQVEVLDDYLKQYNIDRAKYLYYSAVAQADCSQIQDPLPENASVLIVTSINGDVTADVVKASLDQIIDHTNKSRVYLIVRK